MWPGNKAAMKLRSLVLRFGRNLALVAEKVENFFDCLSFDALV